MKDKTPWYVVTLSTIVNLVQVYIQRITERDCITVETLETIIRIAQGNI